MDNEISRVRELGEVIGYGHLMAIASALWREKLKPSGIESGAFIPVISSSVKKVDMKSYQSTIVNYDNLITEETYNRSLTLFSCIPEFHNGLWIKLKGEDFIRIKELSKDVKPINSNLNHSIAFSIYTIDDNTYRFIHKDNIDISIEIRL
jgi:hypothetical protein